MAERNPSNPPPDDKLDPTLQPGSTADPPTTRHVVGDLTPAHPPQATTEIPEQFGRYRIVKKLGQGGMGSVYLAQDTMLARQVALKVPSRELCSRPEVIDRFHREARAAALLNHPNLCPVHDVGEVNGQHFLTMAYIDGKPLSDMIRGRGPLPPREVAALVRKLALALQEAHSKGVIHRDLKPSNIIITPKHEPVITDFGLARRDDLGDPTQTPAGQIVGTPMYMAPEQARGDPSAMGPATDIYALGVILYELLTGRPPFIGSIGEVISQVLTRRPVAPSELCPGLDLALEGVCLRALAKEPDKRHGSMAELADALSRCLDGSPDTRRVGTEVVLPIAAPMPTEPNDPGLTSRLVADLFARLEVHEQRSQRPPRWVWYAGLAALLLMAVVVVWIALRPQPGASHTHIQYVRVKLTNITILNLPPNSGVIYLLNGKEINPDELKNEIDLPVGWNELIVKRGEEEIEKRRFQVGPEDTAIKVPDAETPDPAIPAEAVTIGGLKDQVDDDERELRFTLDGGPISLKELRNRRLKPGLHVLLVKRGEQQVDQVVFVVRPGDKPQPLKLDLQDWRHQEVVLETDKIDLSDPMIVVLIDGVPVPRELLKKPLRLLPGKHELALWTADRQVKETFELPRRS